MSETSKQDTIKHLHKIIETIETSERYQLAFVLNTPECVESEITSKNMQVLELLGCVEVMKLRLANEAAKDHAE
jgi:hypothetical protein